MNISEFYLIGNITKTHGLKGHVLLKLDTDEPSSYYNMESVFVKINEQPVPFFIDEIEVMKPDVLRVLFRDVEAGMLVGKEVVMPLDTLPKLTGNQFYFHEVIGFDIRSQGNTVGKIEQINDQAAQPLFLIVKEDGKEQMLPIIKEWIVEVNRENKYIEMNLPEGITDL